MSKFEVTQQLYKKILAHDPYSNPEPSYANVDNIDCLLSPGESCERRPVDSVTWYDAIYFCNAYSRHDGCEEVYQITDIVRDDKKHIISAKVSMNAQRNGYRLPTEIEWEYAARGGNPANLDAWNLTYSGSDNIESVAWYYENSANLKPKKEGFGPHQVGRRLPNLLGIFDMTGNVSEWCWDELREKKKSKKNQVMRVLCGGNWHNDDVACQITYREYEDKWKGQSHTYDGLGFRLVRNNMNIDARLSTKVLLTGDFKNIKGGNFFFNEQDGAFADINNKYTIKSYDMSLYPVTQALYRCVLQDDINSNPEPSVCSSDNSTFLIKDDEISQLRPVDSVTWYDAIYFCNAYSKMCGFDEVYKIDNIIRNREKHIISAVVTADFGKSGFRLPTEIEWEFAARGGNPNNSPVWNAKYPGSQNLSDVAWYSVNAGDAVGKGSKGYGTHQVGVKSPNELSLYDMCGNVWEWCWDDSGNKSIKSFIPGITKKEYHIVKGGSWYRDSQTCTAKNRNDWLPDKMASDMGFRVVRTKLRYIVKSLKVTDSDIFDFVKIEGGSVDCKEDNGVFVKQREQINVNSFYMSRFEVTQNLYQKIMSSNKSVNAKPSICVSNDLTYPVVEGEDPTLRPVDNITWYDAVFFCNAYSLYDKLEPVYKIENIMRDSQKHIVRATVTMDINNNGYRLPTEIEWEYAARGGNDNNEMVWNSAYSGVNSIVDVAWYKENAGFGIGAGKVGFGSHSVGKKMCNSLGLCDMSGNVAEMLWDNYSNKLDKNTSILGPQEGELHVVRGGSWIDSPFACDVTLRKSIESNVRLQNCGFRVVKKDQNAKSTKINIQSKENKYEINDDFVFVKGNSIVCNENKGAFIVSRENVAFYDYYISKYPVTAQLYHSVLSDDDNVNSNPSCINKSKDYLPLSNEDVSQCAVDSVSWYDAIYFCNEYSKQNGLDEVYQLSEIIRDEVTKSIKSAVVKADFTCNGYRLPTYVEWEYAARGADPSSEQWNYLYSGSDDLGTVGWYQDNTANKKGQGLIVAGNRGYAPHQVGLKAPNSLGLFDMSGNVGQWCWDWFSENLYVDTPSRGVDFGRYKVVCGGAWNLDAVSCQITNASGDYPYDIDANRGFRLVRSGVQKQAIEHKVIHNSDYVFVKGGPFYMGDESQGATSANRVHKVAVSDFYMCKYTVTQKEWSDVFNINPSYNNNEHSEKNPVENVSWYEAVKYCNLLSIRQGLQPCYEIDGESNPDKWPESDYNISWNKTANGYRLPTEAEWEYAARGANVKEKNVWIYKYSGSADVNKVAWYEGNSNAKTHIVGQKQCNRLGLFDMSGNVWQWCWDWYDKDYYKDGQINPAGPLLGTRKVNRGGAYDSYGVNIMLTYRSSDYPNKKFRNVGLRLVRDAK